MIALAFAAMLMGLIMLSIGGLIVVTVKWVSRERKAMAARNWKLTEMENSIRKSGSYQVALRKNGVHAGGT